MTTRTTEVFRSLSPALALAAAALASPNPGTEERAVSVLVLAEDLSVWKGTLLSVDAGTVTVADESRRVVRCEAPGTLAVVVCDPLAAQELGVGSVPPLGRRSPPDQLTLARAIKSESQGVMVITDGQRFIGAPASGASTASPAASGADDALAWVSERFGPMTIPLERLAWIAFPGGANTPARRSLPPGLGGADDALLLRNGDTVRGLIARVGASITLEPAPGDAGEARTFDRERVVAASLSNPLERASGPRLWLADGTVVAPASGEQVPRAGSPRPVRAALGGTAPVVPFDVRGYTPDASRIVPLSSMDAPSFKPIGPRVYAPTPRVLAHADDLVTPGLWSLDAGDVALSGPVEAVWTLDERAVGFVCSFTLENESDPWAGCVVVVTAPGGASAKVELSPETPGAPVALRFQPQKGATLTVRVEAGAFGAVNDRVRLSRPLVVRRPG